MKFVGDASIRDEVLDRRIQLLQIVRVTDLAGCSALDALCSMLLHKALRRGFESEETVHLRAQANELDDRITGSFIFELTDDFVIGGIVVLGILAVTRKVVELSILPQIAVHVLGLDLIHERVCVCEE